MSITCRVGVHSSPHCVGFVGTFLHRIYRPNKSFSIKKINPQVYNFIYYPGKLLPTRINDTFVYEK